MVAKWQGENTTRENEAKQPQEDCGKPFSGFGGSAGGGRSLVPLAARQPKVDARLLPNRKDSALMAKSSDSYYV